MVCPPDSLPEIIRRRQQASFVGREAQLVFFRDNLALSADDPGRKFLFAIHGDGGIGKTFLVAGLSQAARERGWLTALTDHSSYDEVEVMASIAGQLARQGARLKRFEQRYSTYVKRRHELGSGASATGDAASLVTQTAVRVGLGVARSLPLGGVLTEFIDPRTAAQETDQLRAAIVKNVRNRDDARLLLSPVAELTPAFVEGLRQLPRPVALFFDTYEITSDFLDDWLRGLLKVPPTNLVVTVAGRLPLDASRWSDRLWMVQDVPLIPFTNVEARQLLAQLGVVDEDAVSMILNESGGLPLAVAMLAASRPTGDSGPADVNASVVERFLQWESNPQRRDIALAAALPRRLDEDVVAVLAGSSDASQLYDWLARQAFVPSGEGGRHYHDWVRGPMIRLNRGRSRQRWRELHRRLSTANREWRDQLGYEDDKGWSDPGWHGYLLEETYHRLCAEPSRYVPDGLGGIVEAYAHGTTFARKWVEMLAQAGSDADAVALAALAKRLEDALGSEEDPDISFLSAILEQRQLGTPARASAYRMRGRECRKAGRYPQALDDFGSALALQPQYEDALAGRGETYRLMERFGEAVADFSRAIELDSEDTWAIGQRAQAYLGMEHFEEAVADFSRAIELEQDNTWAIAWRGETYRLMEHFEEAVADFSRAIELDSEDAWSLGLRGETYLLMDLCGEAVADFSRAIELDPEDAWAIAWRGVTYRRMELAEQALADFNRAIELDPLNSWAIAERGRTHRRSGHKAEADADLDRAFALEPASYDYPLERALAQGIDRNGNERIESIVDIDATADDRARLVRMITEWMISTGVIEPEPVPDELLGGYPPGPSRGIAVADAVFPTGSLLYPVWITARRVFVHTQTLTAMTCPSCGKRTEIRRDRDVNTAWVRVLDEAIFWKDGGPGILPCPICGDGSHLRDWEFDPTWAVGHVVIGFLNWPPLSAQFIRDVADKLGHRVVVVTDKL
jgi:tetratricopeptide (TPR) repeat protein